MHAAIGCLADKYGFKIIDPSTFFLRDMEHLEQAIKAEIHLIPGGVHWFWNYAQSALQDIHELAAKYDGSICRRDA